MNCADCQEMDCYRGKDDTVIAEEAARIIDDGNIHIHRDVLELNASRSEVRQILGDLFGNERVGTQEAFDAALEAAVDEVSDLEILLD